VRVTEVIEVVVHMRTSPRTDGRKTPSKPKQKAEPSEPRIVGTYKISRINSYISSAVHGIMNVSPLTLDTMPGTCRPQASGSCR
jgi:hypothetical protein